MMRFKWLYPILILPVLGCAASQPIVYQQVRKPQPIPEALAYFIDAKIAEMRGENSKAVGALRAAVRIDSASATIYSALTRNLSALGRYQDALGPGQRAVRLDPSSVDNRKLLYEALIQGTRDTTAAENQLKAISRMEENPLWAYDRLLKIYSSRRDRENAILVLDKVLAVPSINPQIQMIAAQNYQVYNAPLRAESIYRKIVADNPQEVEAWLRLGNSVLSRGDSIQATGLIRESLSIFGNRLDRQTAPLWDQLHLVYNTNPKLESLLAETPLDTLLVDNLSVFLLNAAGQPERREAAGQLFSRASHLLAGLIIAQPHRDDLLARQGQLMLNFSRPQEARQSFRRALELRPTAEYGIGLGHSFLAENRIEEAQEVFQTLYQNAPPDTRFYPQIVMELGRIFSSKDSMEAARTIYRTAAHADPNRPMYRYELGRTYIFEKQWHEAIPVFEKLVDHENVTPELLSRLLFDLGHAYERGGQFEKSVTIFQRLLVQNPEDDNALNYLGYMLAEKGVRLQEAKGFIERALKASPQNDAYLDSMGWVHYQQGEYTEAVEYLERAVAISESDLAKLGDNPRSRENAYENLSVIHDHAGDASNALGDINQARRHWKRALEFDPGNEKIEKKLRSLSDATGNTSVGP